MREPGGRALSDAPAAPSAAAATAKPAEGTASDALPADRVLGRELWKLVPWVRPYKTRVIVGLVTNGFARLFDLLPMVIIGVLVDRIQRGGPAQFAVDDFLLYGLGILGTFVGRSEEHTSELQSPCNLVCRLLLEK